MTKTCTKCNINKPIDKFNNRKRSKDGKASTCRICINLKRDTEKQKSYSKKYRKNNPKTISESNKLYQSINKVAIATQKKTYQNNNKLSLALYQKKYKKERKLNDNLFRLTCAIRKRIGKATKGFKNDKTKIILGCSFEDFKQHIESKFENWMNWENYGLYNGKLNYGWDIDHIIPVSSENTIDGIERLNHFSNLQPLCSYINRIIKKDIINK